MEKIYNGQYNNYFIYPNELKDLDKNILEIDDYIQIINKTKEYVLYTITLKKDGLKVNKYGWKNNLYGLFPYWDKFPKYIVDFIN